MRSGLPSHLSHPIHSVMRDNGMAYRLGFCTLRWNEPDLEPALEVLNEAGWDGWEARLDLDWMGTPARIRALCERTGMPLAVFTAQGTPDDDSSRTFEINKRRMEFAAEVGCDCFMYMHASAPQDRPASRDEVVRAADQAERWAEFAESMELELSFHIHTNHIVNSREEWATYMRRIAKAKLCIDVSHAHLWGWDPVDALREYQSQLNYVHLQEYTAVDIRDGRWYYPEWVDVDVPGHMNFAAIRAALDEIAFDRWVTACPGAPIPGADSPLDEARRSASTLAYLRSLGY